MIVLVSMHAFARILVAAKTPVLALTVAYDEGPLDECWAVVRSVDRVPLLSPAAELDSATAATPVLPIVGTVCNDDSVLAGDVTCAASADTASMTTHRPIVYDIWLDKSDVQILRRPDSSVCTNWRSRCVRIRYQRHVLRRYPRYRSSQDAYDRSSHP
jgi:hypothetical protein